jgi:hypothetical protein
MNKKSIGFLLAGLILLPSCMRVNKYHPQSLKMLRDKVMHGETKESVTIRAKRLNEFEKEYLFNKHIGELEGNQFQIVYVFIDNMSEIQYELLPNSIDLEHLSCADVVKQMKKTSTAGRAIASSLATSYAVAAGINISREMMWPGCDILPILFIPVLGTAVSIAAITGASAIQSWVMNRRINDDLKKKVLSENLIIEPYSHYEGLIFVKSSDYRPSFNVTMYEKDDYNKNIVFEVNMHTSQRNSL